MALPPVAIYIREGLRMQMHDDFQPLKRRPKVNGEDVKVSLAPTPMAKREKENDDDFQPPKKCPKVNPEDVKAIFPQSSISHCTFNINFAV